MAAAAGQAVGRLQEEALRRKERLKALRGRTGNTEEGEPETKQLREDADEDDASLKLRNYLPEDEELQKRVVPQAKPASVEDKVKDQLEAAKPEPIIEEVDLANLAPRKPDWGKKTSSCRASLARGQAWNQERHPCNCASLAILLENSSVHPLFSPLNKLGAFALIHKFPSLVIMIRRLKP
uniref:Coiled-coil domain containing 12 n=1 Tax=Sphenodon punctatus TaxID=8508 RepID=A0A8D0H6G7_SPHPU